MIPVSQPVLPPLEEYTTLLQGVWERRRLTNAGPLLEELERRLAAYLDVRHVVFVTNGTIALQLAIRAAGVEGDVLTTPFSFVATTGALVWERCRPVFVDIEPATMTLDPDQLAARLTPATRAILATHVYGFPCDTEAIERFAATHGLTVIYDAAHAFGVSWKGRSLAAAGDLATLSFHATKLFHTVEGGAVVTGSDTLAATLRMQRNFGQVAPDEIVGLGINGKGSEFQAAMGLCLLPRVPALIARRAAIASRYDAALARAGWLERLRSRAGAEPNHGYYPVRFDSEARLLRVRADLKSRGIDTRRYFHPSLNLLPYVERGVAPVSESVAPRTLCLPLFPDLTDAQVDLVATEVVAAGDRA